MDVEQIAIDEITTLHEITHKRHFSNLVEDMKERGWNGRPILVIERENDYLAWTGTHRIYAAREVGFNTIPCYVINESILKEHGFDAFNGHCTDNDRKEILCKIEDDDAVMLMNLENRPC